MTAESPMTTESNEHEPKKEEGFGDIAASIGSRNLMIAIVTMPIFFLGIVAAIIMIFGKPKTGGDDVASVPSQSAQEAAPAAPAAGTAEASPIALMDGEAITSLTLDGDRLAATVEGPAGTVIIIYDVARGEEVSRIPVKQN